MKRGLCLLYFALCCSFAFAQGGPVPQYAAFTWTNAPDAAGNLLQSGYITFTPVSGSGASVSPNMIGGGRVIPLPVTFKIVAGIAAPEYGTMQLVDVTQANPSNFCYKDTIHDNISGISWSPDACVQPAWNASWCTYTTTGSTSSTTCDFGKYVPTGTPGAMQVAGLPGVNWRGAWSSSNTYAINDGVTYNGSSFRSTIAGNTNNPGSPTSPGTGWAVIASMGASGVGTDALCHTDGSGNLVGCVSVAAGTTNGEINGSLSATPEAAVASACAAGLAARFPTGNSTVGMVACTGLSVLSNSRSALFPITGTSWGLANPNADVTSGSNGMGNMTVRDLTFDMSSNPSALGALRLKGIGFSNFYDLAAFTNNNPQPAQTEDGGTFPYSGGDYDNNFFGSKLYNKCLTAPCTGVGILVQNNSNENHHFGGSVVDFGTAISVTNGNHNLFSGQDLEGWVNNCMAVSGSNSVANAFNRERCETNWPLWAASYGYAGGAQFIDSNGNLQQVTTGGTSGDSAPSWPAGTVNSILSTGDCKVVGTAGQTVTVGSLNHGSTSVATATLRIANTLYGATWTVTAGSGATAAPTSGTCSVGGSSPVSAASGTVALVTSVGTVGATTTDGTAIDTLEALSPSDVLATGSTGNSFDFYSSGYETRVVDTTLENSYAVGTSFGAPWASTTGIGPVISGAIPQSLGINAPPVLGDAINSSIGNAVFKSGNLYIGSPGTGTIYMMNASGAWINTMYADTSGNMWLKPLGGGIVELGTGGMNPNTDNVLALGISGHGWASLLVDGLAKVGNMTATTAAPTVATGQIGYGSTVTANTSCGTLASSAGCVVINVAGTAHYIPYY